MTEKIYPTTVGGSSQPPTNLAPPLHLSRKDFARYYHCLGDIEAFYFFLCRINTYWSKRTEWKFLNRSINQITKDVTEFADHIRPENALCADHLIIMLNTSRRLLWLDDDSENALHDYLEEEGTEISTYNENNWHSDPQFWEDEAGALLNQLVLELGDDGPDVNLARTIDAFQYVNEQRSHILEGWVKSVTEKANLQFAGRMRYWHRMGIRDTDNLIRLLRDPPTSFQFWKRSAEYVLDRNHRCEDVARVYQRVLRPKAYYEEPNPYPPRGVM